MTSSVPSVGKANNYEIPCRDYNWSATPRSISSSKEKIQQCDASNKKGQWDHNCILWNENPVGTRTTDPLKLLTRLKKALPALCFFGMGQCCNSPIDTQYNSQIAQSESIHT